MVCNKEWLWIKYRELSLPTIPNFAFPQNIFSRIWWFSTKLWRERRDFGPEACCNALSNHTSVFACPELPLYNPKTFPPPCYRGPLATFDERFILEFGDVPRNCDGKVAIRAPRLVVTPKAITPACLPAPSYPWTTLQPSLRHATGARWLLRLRILPSISKPYRSNSDRRDR